MSKDPFPVVALAPGPGYKVSRFNQRLGQLPLSANLQVLQAPKHCINDKSGDGICILSKDDKEAWLTK